MQNAERATAADFLPEDTEMGRLVRELDWAATPLGPVEDWSASLRMVVRFVLANRFPMLLWWGPQYIQVYNDAYRPILGTKHPQFLGRPVSECWTEIWDVLKPLVDTPFLGGPATWMEDLELEINRHGFTEESHFTVAYSPVPDEDAPRGIGGVLATVHEITEKVIGERRLGILSELGARVAEAKTGEDACAMATRILSRHWRDVPFALVYLLTSEGSNVRQVGATAGELIPAGPSEIDLTGFDRQDAAADVPGIGALIAVALRTESIQVGEINATLGVTASATGGQCLPLSLVVVPIKSLVANRPAGAVVIGISPRIPLDKLYSTFLELVGSQIATAVANARAYDEERRRAEALAEIDRAKTAFFSNVSHEFRTPLALMLGPVQDLLTSPTISGAARAQLELAHRNSLRLLKLVNSLLDFARIEAGRVQAGFEPVQLGLLTADLASTFRSAMERAGLEFVVDCPHLDEPVYVDREMWEKIVLNLLSNAFKYTLAGRVTVSLRRVGKTAVLDVTDTGVGVPQAELPRLFERFYRAASTHGRTHEGSGIGLALVNELVKLHGGSIEAESEVGRGTTFRVVLPCGSGHLPANLLRARPPGAALYDVSAPYVEEALRWLPESEAAVTPEPALLVEAARSARDRRFASTFGCHIVLADDNLDMRSYVRELLSPLYEVEAVADGEEALAAVRRRLPDLVLCDIMMPKLDGMGLLKALREDARLRDVPVIMLSARAGEESRIKGLSAGADDYIVKPFAARELLARVGALLELTRARRDSELRFRAFVKATSDAVYRMSADWSEMHQLEGREFIANTSDPSHTWLERYIHPEDKARVMDAVREAIRTQGVFELEHRVLRPDGALGWVFSRAIPLVDNKGNITEWFGTASDVTERRRHQQALETADRQKNEFLAMLAHELRNPLAPIRNAGEILSRLVTDDARAHAAVATIARQVTHLTRLVDDLLDVSRITQGRIELRRRVVPVSEVVSRALETVDPLLQAKHHRVSLVSGRTRLTVNGDPERLVQCVANVLSNAAKYTDAAGDIRVETREEADCAVISVSDNGVGMSSDLLPSVFDLFVQADRSLDRAQGGLGIGLSIVKRLIEMHGGSVAARSEGVGKGSTFQIRVPLLRGLDTEAELPAAHTRALRRILVVDDNEDAANSLAMVLQLEGHEVLAVNTGAQALDKVRVFRPEYVLLDIGLPGVDGYEVAQHLRSIPGLAPFKIVAITGYGQDADRKRTEAAGFVGHLVKPIDFGVLKGMLGGP